jgi:hypothetical protein
MPLIRSPFSARIDTRLRLIGPFVLFLTGAIFIRLRMYLDTPANQLLDHFIIALCAGYTGWELTRLATLYIQQRVPGLQHLRKRLVYLCMAMFLLAHVGFAIRFVTHNIVYHRPWKWPALLDYTGATGAVLFYTVITICIYEGAYLWQQGKKTLAEKEQLIRFEWQAKYDLLKAQINPHFLFNSMNTLAYLVSENPAQAEKFIDEMCRIYSYLLRNNDQELVTLDTELQFIRSYCHLLATRYGTGFQLQMKVDAEYDRYLIPPLTLQLLVENAVKHNIVQKERPVIITISVNDKEKLIVANNIQKKTTKVVSHGVGLANINAKFTMLNQQPMLVEEKDGWFVVSIPLIKNE